MAKEAYYFSHDSNARNDEKVLCLRADYGLEGYGIYFVLVEMLHESSDSKLSHSLIRGISHQLNIDITKLESVITSCICYGLLKSDGDKFWSERVNKNKFVMKAKYDDISAKRSAAGRLGMQKRWSNNKSITNDNKRITNDNQRKGKESKINILKEIRYPFGEKFLEKWNMWKDFKKSQFDFVYKTEISEQAALDDLIKISGNNEDAAAEIIMQSVSKGWKGFFKIKNDTNGANRQNHSNNGHKPGTSEARTTALKEWGLGGGK